MLKNIYRSGLYNLLKVFYIHKTKYLNFNKIVELSNLGKGSVARYLKILINDKILILKKEANLIKYQINYKDSVAQSILINFDKEKFNSFPLNIRKVITEIKKSFDYNFIFVFGSFSKGSFSKSSDLDLFISVKEKYLIKESNLIKKLELQYGINIDLQISIIDKINLNQKHIIESGLPVANYENFYEVYFEQ